MLRYCLSFVCLTIALCSSLHADDAPTELTPAVIGKKYAEQISVTVSGAAPFTYALGGEEKPAGLAIDPESGLLHGIPTRAAIGTHRVHVIVTDYTGRETTQDFVLHVTAFAAVVGSPAAAAEKGVKAAAARQHSAVMAKPAAIGVVSAAAKPGAPAVGLPVIQSATSGLKTVVVVSPDFPDGVTSASYQLYSGDAKTTCGAGSGTAVAFAADPKPVAVKSTATNLQLNEALKDGGVLCAEESFADASGKEVVNTWSKPFPVTGAPSIGSAVSGATTVSVTSPAFPANAIKAEFELATIEASKVCADGGSALGISDGSATDGRASNITLTVPLVEKTNVCVKETFHDGGGAVVAIAYSMPVTVAAAPGSPSIASAPAGISNVSVTSPAFPTGVKTATFGVYAVDPGQPCQENGSQQLISVAGTSVDAKASDTVTLTLASPLKEGNILCAVETFKDDKGNTMAKTDSNLATVTSLEADWGRVRAYFVGGVLISNDSSSFSSAHQFYALNVEKTWRLPQCYLRTVAVNDRGKHDCVTEGSYSTLILDGASFTFKKAIRITGGSAKAGPPVTIENAVVTLTDAETIGVGKAGVTLQAGQSFNVTSGTLDGNLDLDGDGRVIGMAGGTLKITKGQMASAQIAKPPANWVEKILQVSGVSTYFETRLTSIPVVSNSANTTCNTSNSATTAASTGGTGASSGTTASSTPACTSTNASGSSGTAAGSSGNTTNSFLTSQQTANVGVGVYLPFLLSRWLYKNTPNALFIAPIGKIGFNTITSATAQTVVLPGNGGTGTQTFEQLYNFYDYGFRVGHMGLTNTTQVAPELYSYLDFSLGRFSNLESLICHRPDQGGGSVTGSGCVAAFGTPYSFDSRKRLYRIDIEGLLKVPNTPVYVGLNANIGQRQVMADKLDPVSVAPNDLRFLFGTKFDIAQLFSKLGMKQ